MLGHAWSGVHGQAYTIGCARLGVHGQAYDLGSEQEGGEVGGRVNHEPVG
jgi:hypothetical protein